MMSAVLEQIRALCSAPWFDVDLGESLVKLAGGQNATAVVNSLRSAGVTVERRGAIRIAEPLRSEYRRSLHAQNPKLYAEVLSTFADHALGGATPIARVMGKDGLLVSARALAYVADRGNPTLASELVNLVQSQENRYESDAARAASRILSTYLYQEDRLSDFFAGLDLWVRGRRASAVPNFDRVLQSHVTDKATCVAAHLVGVRLYDQGKLELAEQSLNRSVSALRALNDDRGLILTLSTLGRVKKEQFRRHGDIPDIEASVAALEEARSLASTTAQLPSILEPLSHAYLLSGNEPLALSAGREAVNAAAAGEDKVSALISLSTVYRTIQDEDGYSETVGEAIQEAEIFDVVGKELAVLLNVRAGRDRRAGLLSEAAQSASRSLSMGRRLDDQRHIAHSAHTLAAICVDQFEAGESSRLTVDEVRALLRESKRLLVQAQDTNGVAMVERTSGRLLATQDEPAGMGKLRERSVGDETGSDG